MTNEEKIERLAVLISPDTASRELSLALIEQSEGIVLNRRYPFGVPEGAIVPSIYEHVQMQIAVELYSKMGAEGQTAHGENGISRSYESASVSPSLLRQIMPIAGSVVQ
jgi:hypothetical protein